MHRGGQLDAKSASDLGKIYINAIETARGVKNVSGDLKRSEVRTNLSPN